MCVWMWGGEGSRTPSLRLPEPGAEALSLSSRRPLSLIRAHTSPLLSEESV